jgi:parallel beta-helix repeat protein
MKGRRIVRYLSSLIINRLPGLIILLAIVSPVSAEQLSKQESQSTSKYPLVDTSEFPNIEAAKAYIDGLTSTKKVLVVSRTENLNRQLTLDANIKLVIKNGAAIRKGTNGKLTVNGRFEAPASQAFIGFAPGEVVIAGTPNKVIPQWWGASGDGRSDDTIAIQSAASSLSNGGNVFIPDGVYIIDPTYNPEGGMFGGIKLKSNTTLTLSNKAVLQAKTVSSGQYSIVRAWDVNNVIVEGGRITGERSIHQGKKGEWGFGIDVRGSSNVIIRNTTISDCWGDGIYLGATRVQEKIISSSIVTIDNVLSDNNRRQGLSITQANDVKVMNSIFQNTKGTLPAAGIDIEPNHLPNSNIRIVNCKFINNDGSGVECFHSRNVTIDSCYFEGNLRGVFLLGGGFDEKVIAQLSVKNSAFIKQRLSSFYIRDYIDFIAENNSLEGLTTTAGGHVFIDGVATRRTISLMNNTFINKGEVSGVYNFRNTKPDTSTVFNYIGNKFILHGKPGTDSIQGVSDSVFKGNIYILENDFSNQLLDKKQLLYFSISPSINIYNCSFINRSNSVAIVGDYNHVTPINCKFSPNLTFTTREGVVLNSN